MEDSVQCLINRSRANKILINHTKTKEMIQGNAKVDKIPALFIEGKETERMTVFKLLGFQMIFTGRAMSMSSTIKCHLDCIF